jgi:putative type I site-specific restriction-modification system, S subunit
MKRYDAYKSTGIPWIPEVPEHWEERRAKNLFVRMEREVQEEDEVVTCFRDGQVTLRKNRRTEGFTESFKEIGYQGIRKGDLVIHQMDAFAGAIGISDSDGKGTPVYICLQPKQGCMNEYYALVIREMARAGYIKALYKGIRERSSDFRYETFAGLFLPLPPLSEQRAIVAYIERKERQIDTYIARQAEQIERLKELRKTIISHAVTRGIHPYTRFRPTGIPWIPEVPEHWEVGLGKRIYSTNDSGVWGSEPTEENDTIVLRSTEQDIEGKLQIISPASRHLSKDEIKQALLFEGDLIITKSSGSSAHIGKTSIIDEPTSSLRCCFSNFLQRIRIKGCPKFYWYIFNSNIVREQFQQMFSTTTGLRNLSASIIGNIFLPLPPLSEQHAIVAYIEKKTATVDRMINACHEQTELMKAYKQRLISDAVTGRINVLPHD